MSTQNKPNTPASSGGSMSTSAAVVGILIAFVAGVAIGHLTGKANGETGIANEAALGAGAEGAAAAPADGVERFRVDVTPQMPKRGGTNPLVTIVMFSDYECPFCGRVEPTVNQLLAQYGDKIKLVWRDNPLPFHQSAMPAAEAGREAFAQGGDAKFWQMHAKLFENQRALSRADLERYAGELGLNVDRFKAALDNHTHQAAITADQQAAARINARGTPAFFINGRQLMGAQPVEAFKTIIDEEITAAETAIRGGTPRNQLYATLMRGARAEAAPPPAANPQQPQARPAQPDPNAVYNIPVGNSATRGPADALVTLVLFSEFQCPFCSRVGPTINQIFETYGRDVRLVFKHNPLPFHPNAGPAAEAASEAYAQKGATGFWAMHDMLFEKQQEWSQLDPTAFRAKLAEYATAQGLNIARFNQAMDAHTHQAAIDADKQLAQARGAGGTPNFFINGRNLRGAQPFEAFQRVIDEEKAKALAKIAEGTPRARVYEALTANGATAPVMLPAADAPAAGGAPAADRVYNLEVPRTAPTKGPANAAVTIQIYSDYQCPFCSRVEPTLAQIEREYAGRVRFVWRNYPLPFHNNAMPAAEASAEVFAQGGATKFWAYHDKLFQNQTALERADLERYATELGGIDMNRFRQALDNHTHRATVQADMDSITRAGAAEEFGTPSFFINGRMLSGAQPFPAFKALIDRALEAPAAPARR